MASIRPYAKGWRAQVDTKGVRDSKVFRTRREADAWAAARETEIRADAGKAPGERVTLGQVLARYREEISPTKRGARWEKARIAAFERDPLLPVGQPIGRLTAAQLGVWRDARLRQVSAGSVLREFGILSAVLEQARREWGMIPTNPAKDVRKPRAPDHREVVITRAQIRAMLVAMGYSPGAPVRSISQAAAVVFLVALRTGMRAGELCGLEWGLVHDGYCRLPVTKTVPRDVPLTAKAMRLIERMRGFDDRLVFGIKSQTLEALFRKYRQRAGLSGFTFHDARHTAATWIAGKVDVLTLCKIFGWTSPNMAMVYYNPKASDIAKILSEKVK
ncbi:MAG: site-specific integrase [Desulfobulbus sp.]|nr:site-specific integrase [Desulfobulbus sp.]